MAMNPNVNMANMNPMGGPVGGAPMPMMNNGVMNPQAAAAAAAAAASRQQQANDNQRSILNTYIYEYFIRMGMFDCARSLLSSDQQVNVLKDGANRRRDENGNLINGVGDDPMDTDSKDDIDAKLPDDLPPPKLPMPASDTSFLYEWFSVFWDIYYAQRAKSNNNTINQYVAHTQQQSRLKQNHQQELLRQMRPDMAQQQYQMMRNMQNGNMAAMNMKQPLVRTAMANANNPQMQMVQQAKQNQMQRDPSGMDGRDRPSSPASGENAPSPSKRQRLEGGPFNPNQPGAMMPNGRPGQGMPGQQMPGGPNVAAAQQMLTANGINPNTLHPQQLQTFVNAPPAAQQKSIATYSQNLQQHHGTQMGGNKMPNAPQGQGSPMMAQGPDGTALNAFYNPGEMGGPGGMRPGPNGPQTAGGSNHALQDYQMQLMLLEQQNKKRLMMARQEQDTIGNGMPREGGPGQPGGPPGPNGQFPDTSPQAMRAGASPNPAEQMKRGTPQMNNSGIPSPVPEGGQSRGSPNPAMNFMNNHVEPGMAPHFFKGMEGNMAGQPPMNGNMRPPSSHPGQPFNGQMTPQMMAQARQQQAQQGQPGQGPQGQQWQQGPNGQMVPQQMQQASPQIQGTPQQRSMPPPQAPPANANNRTTASPQQPAAAPPTPSQTNKAAPKKKESKAAKDKRAAAQKKSNPNLNNAGATPSGDNNDQQETPTPATPINANANLKNGQAGQNNQPTTAPAPAAPAAATSAPPAPPVAPQGHDPNQNMAMDNTFGGMFDMGPSMELANPIDGSNVLNDFDFDSFLHDNDGDNGAFAFPEAFSMDNEIGAD
ncbi:LisH domain-containing protein [Fusarium sp. Ph1]|nr:LisH domain-containing protein [Fusarium sp. Ph1]